MTPYHEDDVCTIHHGDMREVLAGMEEESFSACVCDPPYHLTSVSRGGSPRVPGTGPFGRVHLGEKGFMGKTWDGGGIAFDPDTWRAVLRVLKPGGMLLAFGGTRTFHRMACAVEDAGFEIRDTLMWMYGSGFPKSYDVSKGIDKHGGKDVSWFGPWFRKWRMEHGITQKQVAGLFPSKTGGLTGCVANWELGFNTPTPDQFNAIRDAFGLPFESIVEAERQIVGINKRKAGWFTAQDGHDITAPATPEAALWQGYGTALKPAFEPIILAMKPLDGTFAGNALKHGVAGVNVDGGRVGTNTPDVTGRGWSGARGYGHKEEPVVESVNNPNRGRWPANLILSHDERCVCVGTTRVSTATTVRRNTGKGGNPLLGIPVDLTDKEDMTYADGPDGCEQVDVYACVPGCPVRMLDEQSGVSISSGGKGRASRKGNGPVNIKFTGDREPLHAGGIKDTGTASRFFCTAKASSAERSLGLPDGSRNTHPTVKPIALMRYLVRLVSPPADGLILDPFMGSGSTLVAGCLEGVRVVGVEMGEESCECARARVKAAIKSLLFGGATAAHPLPLFEGIGDAQPEPVKPSPKKSRKKRAKATPRKKGAKR